tara:strand:- start:5 stop:640 length:636 start_codon:yes stop_codon:yes gene_type:complete
MYEFQNKLIVKPWGSEYELFANENVSIWHLTIKPGESTSLHCHPNKKTGLLVLEGAAEVSFLNSKHKLLPSEKVMIRHGVFHRTTNKLSTDLQLLEIETPNDKTDIIRLKDEYGRSGKSFEEGQNYKEMILPRLHESFVVGSCHIVPLRINNIDELDNFTDNHNYMILEGGVVTDFCGVISPGDISNKKDLITLAKQFTLLPSFICDIYHV